MTDIEQAEQVKEYKQAPKIAAGIDGDQFTLYFEDGRTISDEKDCLERWINAAKRKGIPVYNVGKMLFRDKSNFPDRLQLLDNYLV